MIGLDTNVLLRLVLRDDERQFAIAEALLQRLDDRRELGWVSLISLAEFAWALRRQYKRPPAEIADAVDGLLSSSVLELEHEALVKQALDIYRERNLDFPDLLIALSNLDAGCSETFTFDRSAAGAGVMTLLEESP